MVPDIVKLQTKDFEFKSTVEKENKLKKGTRPAQLAIINNSTGQCFLRAWLVFKLSVLIISS